MFKMAKKKGRIIKKELPSLPKCGVCKEEKECNSYPCEVEYRSNRNIKCENIITICDKCFDPDDVYVCKNHEKDVNIVYCDFTGTSQRDSPVYFHFPDLGIRRVKDYICETCKKEYKVCKYHKDIEYKNCYKCLSSFTL